MTQRIEVFLDHVRSLTGLESMQHTRRAAIAALRGLIAKLPSDETHGLAALLGEALAAEAEEAAAGPEAAVAAALGVADLRAREISSAVTVASLEALGATAAALLAALPEELRPTPGAPRQDRKDMRPERQRRETPKQTLAAGRPGSRNPLAEGSPARAHAHSVATSPDPHADTRLSSAKGLTPPARTLADARPDGAPAGPKPGGR